MRKFFGLVIVLLMMSCLKKKDGSTPNSAPNDGFEDLISEISTKPPDFMKDNALGGFNSETAAFALDDAPRFHSASDIVEYLRKELKEQEFRRVLCETSRVIQRQGDNIYIVFGGAIGAFAGLQANTGIDLVWDVHHGEFASFQYSAAGAYTGLGAGLTLYSGLAFGEKKSVVDAWSGYFVSANIDVGIPGLNQFFSTGVGYFASSDYSGNRDYSLQGFLGYLWGGASLKNPYFANVGSALGYWKPHDDSTVSISKKWKSYVKFELSSLIRGDGFRKIILDGSSDFALSILGTFPTANPYVLTAALLPYIRDAVFKAGNLASSITCN